VTIEAGEADLKGEAPLVEVDGWNSAVQSSPSSEVKVELNVDAQVDHWPETGLPIIPSNYVIQSAPSDHYQIHCGGGEVEDFGPDQDYVGGNAGGPNYNVINISAPGVGPASLYQTERWGASTYSFPMTPSASGQTYTVRLYFAETAFDAAGKRKFNVEINGKSVLSDFDVYQESGGKNRAIVREFTGFTPTSDGKIVIKFEAGSADQPEINGIEIKS
jgi:hypothetical protein